jgi:hypothetical protein
MSAIDVIKLLHPKREHHVVHARRNVEPSEMKRSRGAGAGIFAVDDRNAADAHIAQHDLPAHAFLAGDETLHRVADDRGLNFVLIDTRAGERGIDRIARDHLHAGAEILSELHHAGADNRYVTHMDLSLMARLARVEATITQWIGARQAARQT